MSSLLDALCLGGRDAEQLDGRKDGEGTERESTAELGEGRVERERERKGERKGGR